ncbi:hypothetical protein [Kitasatospora sp. NPDC088346]|uniref:hypothetical protein n=1 Tax=Kitasatospora sp. NPDC088346 TaxID=3364073 RepID=UPI003808418A
MFTALEALTDRDPDRRDVAAAALGDLLRSGALDQHTVTSAGTGPVLTATASARPGIGS